MRIRCSREAGAVTMAPRHNWALCRDALQVAGGPGVQAGLGEERSLIGLTLPPNAGSESKGRSFPR